MKNDVFAKAAKKRRIAWCATAAVVILSIFLGAFVDYRGMQGRAVDQFELFVRADIERALVYAHNAERILGRSFGAEPLIEPILRFDLRDIQEHWILLSNAIDALSRAEASPQDADMFRRAYLNAAEAAMMVRQSPYNNAARVFNTALNSYLGFLVRPFIHELPLFD